MSSFFSFHLILGSKQLWRHSFRFIKYWETNNYDVILFISSNIGKQKIMMSVFSFHLTLVNKKIMSWVFSVHLIVGNKQLWRQSFHFILHWETQNYHVILFISPDIGKQVIMTSFFSFHPTLASKKVMTAFFSFHLILGNKRLWCHSFRFIKYWETKNFDVILFISSNIGKQKIMMSVFSFHLTLVNKQLSRHSFHFT